MDLNTTPPVPASKGAHSAIVTGGITLIFRRWARRTFIAHVAVNGARYLRTPNS